MLSIAGMSLYEMEAKVRRFCEKRNWKQYHTPKEVAIGLSTESNELLQLFRFKSEDEQEEFLGDEQKREEIENELADILYFLLLFSDSYGVDLEAALQEKIEQNKSQYPQNKYEGSNEKYNE
jgi:NTP pyrophosphatase (non-canonical NTP hydrolase)